MWTEKQRIDGDVKVQIIDDIPKSDDE